jgi:predicted GNAT family N-acyltransferase
MEETGIDTERSSTNEAVQINRPELLNAGHDTSDFQSQSSRLNDWLKNRALNNQGDTARTYVVTIGEKVIAYYCLCTSVISRKEAVSSIKKDAPDPIPAILIGRLAVDSRWAGKGIGSGILKDAVMRILQASHIVGTRAILVEAAEGAESFYTQYGFKPSTIDPTKLMIRLEDAKKTLGLEV